MDLKKEHINNENKKTTMKRAFKVTERSDSDAIPSTSSAPARKIIKRETACDIQGKEGSLHSSKTENKSEENAEKTIVMDQGTDIKLNSASDPTTKHLEQIKEKEIIQIGSGRPCKREGTSKKVLHGLTYQMKLAMLFAVRGLIRKCNFEVAIDVGNAGSLDELVFLYEEDEIGLFEAIHRRKKFIINREALLSEKEKDDFSVFKYFRSYLKILNQTELQDVLKDRDMTLILNTNVGIKSDLLKESFECITRSSRAGSKILGLGTKKERKGYYFVKKDKKLYKGFTSMLKKLKQPWTKEEVDNFFNILVFAVNQPNDVDLTNIIETEIGRYVGKTDKTSIASQFQLYMQEWTKQEECRYLTNKDIEQQIAVWGLQTLTEKRLKDCNKYKCTFEKDNKVIVNLSNFLNIENDTNVFCLYNFETLFTEIKVCQVFEWYASKNVDQKFIFCDIADLIDLEDTAKCLIKAFSSQTCNILFVSIRKCELDKHEEKLLCQLLEIVSKSRQRKRLIISILKKVYDKSNLYAKFGNILKSKPGVKPSFYDDFVNKFCELDEQSRGHLIEKGSMKFNGNNVSGLLLENEFASNIEGDLLLKLISSGLEITIPLVRLIRGY